MNKITVYGKPGCVGCKATERHLTMEQSEYEYVCAVDDSVALERLQGAGWKQLPVVEVFEDGVIAESWSGFHPEKLTYWGKKL